MTTVCALCGLLVIPGPSLLVGDSRPHSGDQIQQALLKTFVDELVAITPGEGPYPSTYQMGSVVGEAAEQPVRRVAMKSGFAIARYEVPQDLYEAVMGENPSRWKGPRNSAENMSWADAVQFCQRLTVLLVRARLIEPDEEIRLPTEAEWEYCCRAGTTTSFSFGPSATEDGDTGPKASLLDAYGWHHGNAAGNDPEVGVLKPNAWGLYDMHGYLWEYVSDPWTPTPSPDSSEVKPGASQRTMRGGSWRDHYSSLRSSCRRAVPDHVRSDAIGFRCVRARRAESPR